MKLKVVEYLENNTYEDLEREFGIKANVYSDRVVLNYSQIESPKHDPIVKECRALILSIPDHRVISRTFDRFFNYGEDPKTNEFKINEATIDEKIDGSLMPVYHDGSEWQVATRKMAFAEGEVSSESKRTFRDVFVDAIGGEPNDVFAKIDKDLVIIFELTSPETRVVKPYQDTEVYMLDVINKNTGIFYGRESTFFWDIPKGTKWKYPSKYTFKSWNDCLNGLKELPALDEGYVAIYDYWRIKIKNPSYLAISNLRMNGVMSTKRICLLVLSNDHEEYLSYFSEDQKNFDPYIEAYKSMILDIDQLWAKYRDIEDQKEFALAIKDCHAKNILFGMRNKKQKIHDVIENMTDNAKEKLLKGYVGRKE